MGMGLAAADQPGCGAFAFAFGPRIRGLGIEHRLRRGIRVPMAGQLLYGEGRVPHSAGQTVGMRLRTASGAGFVAFRLTQNKPPLQIRHRAALTITTAITFDPVLAGFGLARHDGTASVTAAKRNSVNGNRDSLRENRPGINTCQADGPVFADIDIGTAFDEPDPFVGSDGNFVADQLADGLEELGQVFAAGREACLFDDMQKVGR